MSTHPLTNFETQKYYRKEQKCNDVYSRNTLPKIKKKMKLLDAFKSIWTHWIALHGNGDCVGYYDSFGVEHITKEN